MNTDRHRFWNERKMDEHLLGSITKTICVNLCASVVKILTRKKKTTS
jgi:hypothetical protein